MYESGYLLFQGFLEANLKCFWNASLLEAMRQLQFQGYVSPGVLLVSAGACALEVVRSAWARNVLRPPANYSISAVGDVDSCGLSPLVQGQFTPLPEALCWVILELQAAGQPAVPERIRSALCHAFPDMTPPTQENVYDALAALTADRKVYQTSQGYFVVTPERRRRRHSHSRSRSEASGGGGGLLAGAGAEESVPPPTPASGRQMLLSTEEALALVHGEMATLRDGDVTHQAVQTNLADVVCGEKGSLLSRLFRRSGRKQRQAGELSTFSAQFPPSEWFNPRVVHLHSVGTQTRSPTPSLLHAPATRGAGPDAQSQTSFPSGVCWTDEEPATLPRRHRHRDRDRDSASASASSLGNTASASPAGTPAHVLQQRRSSTSSGRPRHRSPSAHAHSSTLPRRSGSGSHKADSISRAASRGSIQPAATGTGSGGQPPSVASSSSPSSQISVVAARPLPSRKSSASGSPGMSTPSSSTRSAKASPVHLKTTSTTATASESGSPSRVVTGGKSNSPPSSSSNSSQCQSSGGQGSVTSSATISSGGSVTVTSETPTATATTTINGTNTKIYVQQQNSPVRSIITFENNFAGSNGTDRRTSTPAKEILIINGKAPETTTAKEKVSPQRPKLERPTSLYTPREAAKEVTPEVSKFPSVESLPGTPTITRQKLTNMTNNSLPPNRNGTTDDATNLPHPNSQPPSTPLTSDLNNARVLKAAIQSSVDSLSYKNMIGRTASKNNLYSNPSSPTKSFGGSYGNLFIENLEGANKLNHQELFSSMKNLDENAGSKEQLYTYPSLSDLTVHFKSIAAQKILKGISINSVDTLVEVNMAAAEKQNNRDVTVHTDFGVV
ncbi:probable serine/threonine-protein kinase nek3 isoform X2 [Schistocerca nitens]|uniref:probable serine/threonine-protein kinase nek3 isoform X2 n=1 Tax=Schistocerca nitens TaxID=7011 RepID=UPI0021193910|nr:probable serine/threonine-protein kinase nek3 isoform X2 [Schistocerca nitens]